MGSCCTSAAQQTTPDTTSTVAERSVKDTKSTAYEDISSSSDGNFHAIDTQDSGNESGNETSVSITQETKQRIIAGFKDAVQKGNDSLVSYYIQEHSSLNLLDVRFSNGDHSLHVAVRNKAYPLIKYLLEHGVSPNIQNNKNGETALHTAARTRELNCALYLSQCDADVNITNKNLETALTIASENGDDDIIELLSPRTQSLIGQHIKRDSQSMNDSDVARLDTMTTHRLESVTDDILNPTEFISNDKDLLYRPPTKNYQLFSKNDDNKKRVNVLSLEEKLNEKDVRKLKAINIARTNPFSKLKQQNTQKALVAMQSIITEAGQLPKLEAWLEKKKSKMGSWQKRWVIVKETHLLWSDKQRTINNPKNGKERAKFNGNFSLMVIIPKEGVIAVTKGKSQRKFKIITREGSKGKSKEHLFKAASREDRDYWVKSLKIHIKHNEQLISYLGTKH